MGRKKGVANRPGSKKPGPTADSGKYKGRLLGEVLVGAKVAVIEELETGEHRTLTQAAKKASVPPHKAWSWKLTDPMFSETVDSLLMAAKEVASDKLEQDLLKGVNASAKMTILEGWRPQLYRNNYRVLITDSRMLEYLDALRKAASVEGEVIAEPGSVTGDVQENRLLTESRPVEDSPE